MTLPYRPWQSIGYAIQCGVRYYGSNWWHMRTIIWTADGYKLLMQPPRP